MRLDASCFVALCYNILCVVITHDNFCGRSLMTSDTSGLAVYEATTVISRFWVAGFGSVLMCNNELRNAIDRCADTAKKNR